MKLMENWRFAVKCIKLSYNLKTNLLCIGFLSVMALVYEIGNLSNGMGGILMLTVSMYPAQMVYSVCGSQLVLSSPYKKAIMTSLPTIITFCSGMLAYLAVIGIEGIRAMGNPEAAQYSIHMILLLGVMLMIMEIYMGIAYKYFVVSIVVMIGCVTGSYYLMNFSGDGVLSMSWFSEISMPVAIAVGLCFVVLGSLLQYGITLLIYKKPVSRGAIFGLLRQQA